jgi:tetratricopeptide (TPR) repeat protein
MLLTVLWGACAGLVLEGNVMIRRLAFVALVVLSTLTMGAGERGIEPGRQDSSPREDEGQLLNDRGVILLGIGRLDQAIDLFTQAIARNPHLAFAYYNRGNAYLLRKEPERAIADYSDTIRIDPDFALAFMNRGVAHSTQNNLEGALRDLNKAVELAPRTLDAYYNRAMVFTKLGRLLEAAEDYTTAIDLNERDSELYVARGHVWENLKEVDKAIADYRNALAIDPKNERALWRLNRLDAQRRL